MKKKVAAVFVLLLIFSGLASAQVQAIAGMDFAPSYDGVNFWPFLIVNGELVINFDLDVVNVGAGFQMYVITQWIAFDIHPYAYCNLMGKYVMLHAGVGGFVGVFDNPFGYGISTGLIFADISLFFKPGKPFQIGIRSGLNADYELVGRRPIFMIGIGCRYVYDIYFDRLRENRPTEKSNTFFP